MTDLPKDVRAAIAENRGQFTTMGVLLTILGIVSIFFPLVASIATKLMIGAFFAVAGAVMLYHAFQARSWRPGIWSGLAAVLNLAVGIYLLAAPLTGLVGITLLMAVVIGAQGVAELILSWQHRPGHGNTGPGWAWLAVSGVISVVLALLLLLGLPGTALWALGLFVGINFLTTGLSFIMLARAA